MPELHVLNNVRNAASPGHGGISGTGGAIGDAVREKLAGELGAIVGEGGEVRFGLHDRLLYSTDASLYQVEPIGVVVPGSVDDAARVVAFCGERGVPMLARGGGTSLAGQCTNRAVVIDLTPRCRGVRGVDAPARRCEVEPGISIDEVNEHLARLGTGLFFAPDPATTRQCAIGGAIGNNAAGARSILYGRTSENVERIEVALATGGGERLWLGPNAGATNATARRLGAGVLEIVRAYAALIRERFPKTVRRNAGYGLDMILDQAERGATAETVDLAKLLCGSEGTLAVTLGATLLLHPLPQAKGLALLAFDSVDAAIDAVLAILTTGPSAVELLDDVVLDAARGNEECRKYLEIMPRVGGGEARAILYVEYFAHDAGNAANEITSKFAALRAAIGARVSDDAIHELTDAPSMGKAWALRKHGEPLLHGMPGKRKPITFVEDNAVPPERLGEFVRKFREIVARHGTRAAYWAHASVGVLHVRPMIDIHDAADRERLRAIAVEVADLARECGGIMSGEHGDGRVRGPLLERFFGAELMRAFADVKRLFDPKGLLNPGNIVGAGGVESITESLRVGVEMGGASGRRNGDGAERSEDRGLAPLGSELYFDYSDTEGFGHAVEQCNGAGVCRKRGGVMCPSYQATLDERHSTRGRGNALRLAICGTGLPARVSGASPEGFSSVGTPRPSTAAVETRALSPRHGGPDWSDAETIKTLDLCLSCKACKSECPSNVDIARLKAEYTAQRFRATGRVPIAALATGYVRVLNRVGSIAPGLANAVSASGPARAIINRIMGMHPKRTLPRFSKSLYALELGGGKSEVGRAGSIASPTSVLPIPISQLVLFTDCFSTYNESRVGVAAMRVLRALGYAVRLSPSHCCGRSMISVGMLAQAIETIDRAVEALRPAIEDASVRAIIVCEPSCLSAIKDEWLTLKCRTPLALRQRLAAQAMLPEDFVDRYWDSHPIPPRWEVGSGKWEGKPDQDSGPPTSDPARAEHPTSDILFHAHCHQKSLWGAEPSARLLRRLVGDRLKILDTGCCGMAGSFGFARDKYELSMQIGELSLLPIVREAAADAIIVATGTSCRHQIHDGAGREAMHPIELVARMIGEE